jgi:hypothetical protein
MLAIDRPKTVPANPAYATVKPAFEVPLDQPYDSEFWAPSGELPSVLAISK